MLLGTRSLDYLVPSVIALALVALTGCGTIRVSVDQTTTPAAPSPQVTATQSVAPLLSRAATPPDSGEQGMSQTVVAWYGQVHSVSGADPRYDYLKLWHLNIWHKYGRAVGVVGDSPAIDAEIDRVRDRDIRVSVWGTLACGVGDYGACQLRVTRLSANDGGPTFDPERVEGWEGTIGWLPGPPGSQQGVHLFVLSGEVPVLYGVTSADPSIQEQFGDLQDTTTVVRIWGELRSRVQPVTGTLIDVERLEIIPAPSSP